MRICSFLPIVLGLLIASVKAQDLPPHPRLLLDRNDVDKLKAKIAEPFAAQWKVFKDNVDERLDRPVELPPRGGNWSHNYVCPEHATRLRRGKQIGPWKWEHICHTGPHTLLGDPSKATLDFDGNAIMSEHNALADSLVRLGVVYQMTEDPKYAQRAREILLAYAEKYLTYPMHDNLGRPRLGGRVGSQSLSEATWLVDVVQGADLVWQTLSPEERQTIETRLLRPPLDEILFKRPFNIHNIQCWQNSAIGLVGFLVGDKELIQRAIDDPKMGFRQQIAQGVSDDGLWFEGASGYHFYTINGLLPLAEAARHCGIDLYDARFRSMFDGPLAMAMPDLRLPNFNDSGIVDLTRNGDLYDLAYARWGDASHAAVAAAGQRKGRLALLYGVESLPDSSTNVASGSRQLPASGYAILQQGTGDNASWLCVKHGPHGGWHGHFDKNHFILWHGGNVLLTDAGMHAYGSPLHSTWDRHSLAHNTLVVDEKSQAQSEGRCVAFGSENGIDYVITDAGAIYPNANVRFLRTIAMINPKQIVVIDQIRADGEHKLDLAIHPAGKWDRLPDGTPWAQPTQGDGYNLLADVTTRQVSEPVTLRAICQDQKIAITLAGNTPTEIITGTAPGESTTDRVPIAIFRRIAGNTAYVWTISLDGNELKPEVTPAHDGALTIRLNDVPGGTVELRVDGERVVCHRER